MSRFFWLKTLSDQLALGLLVSRRRRRSTLNSSHAEVLEPRKLLSAVPAIGSEAKVNTVTSGDQTIPVVATDSAGDYVIVWQGSYGQDGSGNGIYAQRFDAHGAAQGSEFLVNTYTLESELTPSVAMDAAGDFVITWVSVANQDGVGDGVFAQRYNASGVRQGGEFQVNTYTYADQKAPSVAMDTAGDFVITWQSTFQYNNSSWSGSSSYHVYAQRFNAAGVAQGTEFKVDSASTARATEPEVAMDSAGDFVITWLSLYTGAPPLTNVAAKRYSANGTVAQNQFEIGTTGYNGQNDPAVAMDAAGDFVVTWWGLTDDSNGAGVQAQKFNANGTAATAVFQVNTTANGNQSHSSVAFGGNNDFVIDWQSQQDGSDYGVYTQQYDVSANKLGTETKVNTFTSGYQGVPRVAMDNAGDIVAVWQSNGEDGSGAGIYSQQFLTETTPMLLQIEQPTLNAAASQYTPVTSALNVRDVQSGTWTSATIKITGNYQNGQDTLVFLNTPTITGSWNAATGTLTLTGSDTVSNYRVALRSVTYHNTSHSPNTSLIRTISFQVTDGLSTMSNIATRNVAVTLVPTGPASAVGFEVQVNTYTTGDQATPVVATDAVGNYVVAWQSNGQDGSGWGIFAQRFNALGVPQGAEFRVNTTTTGDQYSPTTAMDAAGAFAIAWISNGQDGSGQGIYAQRFNASGGKQGTEFQVNTYTSNNQTSPSIAMDAAGDLVITWNSEKQYPNDYWSSIGSGEFYSVYAQRYNAAGVRQGAEFPVDTSGQDNDTLPSVSMDSAGDFVIAWGSFYGLDLLDPSLKIVAKRYNSSGGVTQGQFIVGDGGQRPLRHPSVAMDGSGGFAVAFEVDNQDLAGGEDPEVASNFYDANGNMLGGSGGGGNADAPLSWAEINPHIAADANGDYIFTWQDAYMPASGGPENRHDDGSGYGINSQQLDASGNPTTGMIRVNTYTAGDQVNATAAMDAQGDLVVVWQSNGQDGSGVGIYSQRYAAATGPQIQTELSPISVFGGAYTTVSTALTVNDTQSPTLIGATVSFTGGYQNGQDVLSFTSSSKITGSFNAATGILTLTGIDTIANYQAVLRSVTYHNTSSSPNTAATRTIGFQVTDAHGTKSNVSTRQLTVRSVSIPPTVSGLSPSLTYAISTPPITMAPNLVITEPDKINIQSATVTFTNWQAEDRVNFYNSAKLQHTFVQNLTTHTATLTLTGSATAAQYQTELRSVTYQDVAAVPNMTAVRHATFTVNDVQHSASASTSISVMQYLTGVGDTVTAYHKAGPVALAPNMVISPPSGITTLNSATITFTNWQPEDRVTFSNSAGLQHTLVQDFTAHTATLTLTGTKTAAQYQAELRTVAYQDVAGNPITTNRTVKFTLNDGTNTTSASKTIVVSTANRPPVVQVNDSSQLSYKINTTSIQIMKLGLVSDTDDANLSSLTVQITSGYQSGHDVFGWATVAGITGSFNTTTGKLTLSGTASIASYQQILRSVTFHTVGTGVSAATRVFTVIANDTTGVASTAVTRSMTVHI